MLSRFERFSLAIAQIDRYWHKLAAEEMAEYNLHSPHVVYLHILYQNPEGITAARLGELCGKNKADVSRMVSILEKKGLVTKEATGNNLYRALLKLTDEGKQAAEFVRRRAELAVELAGEGLTEEDRRVLYSALERIAVNLQNLSKDGLPTK